MNRTTTCTILLNKLKKKKRGNKENLRPTSVVVGKQGKPANIEGVQGAGDTSESRREPVRPRIFDVRSAMTISFFACTKPTNSLQVKRFEGGQSTAPKIVTTSPLIHFREWLQDTYSASEIINIK
jgi:hypothetical protein